MWRVERGKFTCISTYLRKYKKLLIKLLPLPISSVDSIMLLEEGYEVVSVDASDKMLKYALKERWNRRKEPAFDSWGKSPQSTNKLEK